MPQPAVVCDLGVPDLGDEFRFRPMRAAERLWFDREGRFVGRKRLQQLPDAIELGAVEAGADIAGVDQFT